MSDNQEYIDISSDSSSDSESNRMPPPPYLPPCRPPRRGSRTKEEARRIKHDINAKYLPWHRDYKSPPPQASSPPAQPVPATLPAPPTQRPSSPPVQPNPYPYPAQRYSVEEYMPKSFLKTLSAHLAKIQSKPSEPSSETPTPPAAIPSQPQAAQTEGSSRPSGVIVGLACKRDLPDQVL